MASTSRRMPLAQMSWVGTVKWKQIPRRPTVQTSGAEQVLMNRWGLAVFGQR